MSQNNLTWGKFAQYVLPVILTALIAVIGFLVAQVISLRTEIGDLKVQLAQEVGKVQVQLGRQDVTVRNLSNKIDAITQTRFRGDSE
jgi:sensor domain CHASE-containing protein